MMYLGAAVIMSGDWVGGFYPAGALMRSALVAV